MSVLSVINHNRSAISEFVSRPQGPVCKIRVPPVSGSPQRMGSAFDYALRIGLQKRFAVVDCPLLALDVVDFMSEHEASFEFADIGMAGMLHDRAIDALDRHQGNLGLPYSLAVACLYMASLEVVRRRGVTSGLRESATRDEIQELQSLYALVPWQAFEPKVRLFLNPTFNEGSAMIGGGDADLLLDSSIIEVKTIKGMRARPDDFRQIAIYAVLANEYGVGDKALPVTIDTAGLYLARAGELLAWPLEALASQTDQERLLSFLQVCQY